MAKRVFSFFMGLIFLLIFMQQALIIMHFKINQNAIEAKFCINKDQPELQCKGKCYLKKELQETENNDLSIISVYKNFEFISFADAGLETLFKPNANGIKSIPGRVIFRSDPCIEILTPPPDYL